MNIVLLLSLIILAAWASRRILAGKYISPENVFMDRDYTTVLKGLAILFIMSGHCASHWAGGRLLTPLGGIGVAIFLITSGYGLNESYKTHGLSKFWRKRISKVYLPYMVMVLVWALFVWKSWDHFLLQIICVESMYWFVPYIIACYLLFWLCSYFFPSKRLVLFFITGFASIIFLPELQAEQALSFPVGVLLSEYKESCRNLLLDKTKLLKISCLFLLLGGGMLLIKQLPYTRAESAYYIYNLIQMLIKFPLAMAVVVGLGSVWRMVVSPLVIFSGMISYELYLVHFPFYIYIGPHFWLAVLLFVFSYVVSWYFNKLDIKFNKTLFGT